MVHKIWNLSKRVILSATLLFLIACSSPADPGPTNPDPNEPPTNPNPTDPKTVKSISGVVANWDAANGTFVHFASYGEGDMPQYFSAPISAEGAFSVALAEPKPEQLFTANFCSEAEDSPEFRAATISLGHVSSQAEPQEATQGRLILGNNYEFFSGESSEASVGDRRIEWWYSDKELAFSGECEDIIYAVEFEKGWNLYHTIVESVEGDTATLKVETGPVPENVSWVYISEE